MPAHSRIDVTQPIDLEKLPASLMLASAQDPANAIPGAPPMFGQDFVPHIYTTAGYVGSAARAYPIEDEALRSSPENAERMRTECGIMECLQARQLATALLPWHLEPEDPDDPRQKELVVEMTKILERTPRFTELRRYLMEAIWYGRYMAAMKFESRRVGTNWRVCVKDHEPRHGDKILFRYDDGSFNYKPGQIGIRVHATWAVDKAPKLDPRNKRIRHKVEATQYGLAYWLDDYERRTVILHRHMVEDGPFGDPRSLGRINGIGIRDRIYWTWYAMQECLADLLTFLARAATGVRLWRYPSGNPQWKERVEAAAKNALANGVADILFPVEPNEFAALYGVEQIEPGVAGAAMIKELIQSFFLHKIKRYILGQTLTSEAEATGLGSGVADAHLATLADIVAYDAGNLEETLTTDLVTPLKDRNFPEMAGCLLRLVIDTESPDAEKQLQAFEAGWNMGLAIREDDLYSMLGARRPDSEDAVLRNPNIAAAQQQIEMNAQQMQMQQAQQAMGLLGGVDASGQPAGAMGGEVPPGGGTEVGPATMGYVGPRGGRGERDPNTGEVRYDPRAGEASSPGGLKPEAGPEVLADPAAVESSVEPQVGLSAGPSPEPSIEDNTAGQYPGPGEMLTEEAGSTPGGTSVGKMFLDEWARQMGGDGSAAPTVGSMFRDAWTRQGFLDAWRERMAYSMTAAEIDEAVQGWKAPTEAQIEAENYRKPRVNIHGLEIAIENPKGTRRRPEWPELHCHYGYCSKVAGKPAPEARDGDKVDIFIGPNPESEIVFVVDQEHSSGKYDEPKVMLGFTNEDEARAGYLKNYTKDWHVGPITAMTVGQFRAWLEHGDTSKRVAEQVSRYSEAFAADPERYMAAKFKPMAGQMSLWGPEDEQKHPREKQGEHGGEFTKKGAGGGAGPVAAVPSPPPVAATPPATAPRELSVQEEVDREWAQNASDVSADPTKAKSRSLHRAMSFLEHYIQHHHRQLQRGEITQQRHDELVQSIESEKDWYGRILKERGDYAGGGPYSDEKQRPRKPRPIPPKPELKIDQDFLAEYTDSFLQSWNEEFDEPPTLQDLINDIENRTSTDDWLPGSQDLYYWHEDHNKSDDFEKHWEAEVETAFTPEIAAKLVMERIKAGGGEATAAEPHSLPTSPDPDFARSFYAAYFAAEAVRLDMATVDMETVDA